MDKDISNNLQSQLMGAYSELSGKQPRRALQTLLKIQLKWSNHKDVEHLLALTYKALGEREQAEMHFRQCLRIEQDQPEVYNNLANLLKAKGELVDAERYYVEALLLNPRYVEAQRNLAICYQAQLRFKDAISSYRQTIELAKNDVSSINGIADCLRFLGDFDAAYDHYQLALSIDPKRAKSWHNLGVNHHLAGQLNEAIHCYRTAFEVSPNTPEIAQSFALSLYENGEVSAAVSVFTQALSVNPQNVELHERFNAMLWETEYAGQFGDSYEVAIQRLSNADQVVLSYTSMLYKTGRVEQAKNVINGVSLSEKNTSEVLSLKGKMDAELGGYDSAYGYFEQSLALQFSNDVAQQMVKLNIILRRYGLAQNLLSNLLERTPHCQLTWAFQSLVWRLSGDARYKWLCDYQRFVGAYQLKTPAGYASLDEFLIKVSEVLGTMHRTKNQPLEQTLRNGTQTSARLLHSTNPVLVDLKEGFATIVRSYIDNLPDDSEHPFLSRKSSDFEFSGSWSVRLRPNGFHVNHVHPEGWLSSSSYIAIPASMGSDSELKSSNHGHIKFGESPLQLAERELVELTLEPKLGMVVLFPSYFWHGTIPFDGEQYDVRLTAPFDVVPL